ncbi:uncharacterized protein EI90DRAFT_3060713 [Cantharellus anzutake]|uniref:uncharacterized protein n=1 Tax=Cantharellus anzutake TaxID=1750568 RepID=UPI00190416B6|nr:uncharacterized protein EI90DRAFT_3060713 [Cantharellus anzutake]KAF8330425.1 hypothetical protein EI90DRAFT_3060713 [Cantharellus anzutake]
MSPPHTPASSDIEVAEEVSPTKSNVPLKDAPLLSLEDAQAPLTSRSASPNRSIPQTMHRPTNHLNRRRSRAKSDPATPSVGLKKPLPTESPVSANPKLSPSTVGTSSAATPTMTVPTMSAPFINAEMISLSGHSPQPWKHSSLPPPHASYFPTFVPYMNPSEGSLSSQQGNGGSSPLPPLQPTGFVQNEQGMLIPLYRNEALNQYMAATSHRSPTESNGATYWNHPPPWQPPPPWLPQQAITHHIPSVPTATQLLPGYPLAGYTIDAESMSRSPSQASNRQHHSSTPNSHNMSAVPTASQYPTPKLEPAQPALITSGSQAASLQTPGRGRARNSHHNVKSSRGSYHPHNIGSDARMSGHGPTFQQMAEGKLVSTFSPHGNQGRPPSANTNSAEVIGRPYPPMYGYPQFYDQYITPFPPPTHYPLPQHVQAPSGYPRGPSMQSQWTALPSAYENI